MAVLQKLRAEKLGYNKDLAKAIWIAEATKYAIFKNIWWFTRKTIEKKLIDTGKIQTYKDFEKMNFDENFKLHFKDWWPFVWGKIFTPANYDTYFHKFSPDILERLEAWWKQVLQDIPEEILKNESKFFNQVWKPHRDDEI